MKEFDFERSEQKIEKAIESAEKIALERNLKLDQIITQLIILNRLLGPIVREIAEMNGKTVEEMLIIMSDNKNP